MKSFDPKTIATADFHQFMLASVAPRPIAFVSTLDDEGVPNLAPYSFFNAFSSNPPILVFSSNRRVENNTTKDTLKNAIDTRELVVNVVNYDIVRQMALTSVEFPSNIDEFEKAGFNKLPSTLIKPFRVKESPVQMECKVTDIITLGDKGGAGHLIICEVVWMHIAEHIIDERGRIDPNKIDLVGRMGRFWYTRASQSSIFELVQSVKLPVVGFDNLPKSATHSKILSGNNIAQIANLKQLPTSEEIESVATENNEVSHIIKHSKQVCDDLQLLAKQLLDDANSPESVELAAKIIHLADRF
ncbi:MAG: flavin reductase family protein [Saprospiraceae bacterium]|nr:flavin reductase family protein [Saprospiraceae bacterium]